MTSIITKKLITLSLAIVMFLCVLSACSSGGKEHKINFYSDDEVYYTIDTAGKDEISLPTAPTKANYTFDGWYFDDGIWQQPLSITSFVEQKLSDDISIYAKWTENAKYFVTFVGGESASGTAPTEGSQYEGASIILPANTFTKANYTFNGWSDGDTTYNAGASYIIGTANVTFTAQWTENAKYSVTFVGGESSTGTAPLIDSQFENASIILPANTFAKANYTFSGWNDGETIYNAGASYIIGTESVTFTAQWTAVTYTITYENLQGATHTNVATYNIETETISLSAPTDRAHYDFDGWYIDATKVTVIVKGSYGNKTLTASWTEHAKYSVTFIGGEGATGTAPTMASQYEGASITLPANTFAKANYTFRGWNDGETAYNAGASYEIGTESVTFTAQWTENAKYSVTFIGGEGATGTAPTMASQYEGASITLPANTFAKANYTFSGWNDGDTAYNAGASYVIGTESVTFTAQWTEHAKYTVTFIGGEGATGTAPIEDSQYEGASITLPESTFSKVNYAFSGWSDGSKTYKENTDYTIGTANLTFTAIWNYNGLVKYTLSYDKDYYIVSGFKNGITNAVIEATYNGLPVTEIGANAFEFCDSLESVTIPDSVTIIEACAFYKCISLTSITIPDSVKIIGALAFADCHLLDTINFGVDSQLETVEGNAFDGSDLYDSSLEGVVYIGTIAYIYNGTIPEVTSITLQEGTTVIAEGVFRNFSNLSTISIPSSVLAIGRFTFADCIGLTDFTFNGTKAQWDAVFKDVYWDYNTGFDQVTCSDGASLPYTISFFEGESSTEVAYTMPAQYAGTLINLPYTSLVNNGYLFTGWTDGTNEYLTGEVYSIPSADVIFTQALSPNVIYEYDDVAEAYFVSGFTPGVTDAMIDEEYNDKRVNKIADSAFLNCTELKTVYIPHSVEIVGTHAFKNCTSLFRVIFSDSGELSQLGDGAFANCSSLFEIVLPFSTAGEDYMGDNVFDGCNRLIRVTYLNSVDYLFPVNPGIEILNSTSTPFKNAIYSVKDDILTYTVGSTVYLLGYLGSATTLDLTDTGISAIYQYAFCNNESLTDIILPNNLTGIGYSAFYNTAFYNKMTEVALYIDNYFYKYNGNMPSNTIFTLREGTTVIADGAFSDQDQLTEITIPSSVTNIGVYAFANCTGLTSITFNGTKAEWEAVTKAIYWDDSCTIGQVICSDGPIGTFDVEFSVDDEVSALIIPTLSAQYPGTKFMLPEGVMSKEGYILAGWSDGTGLYKVGDYFVMPSKAVTFTAIWNPNVLYSYDSSNDTYYVSNYTSGVTDALIDSMYNGKFVTAIEAGAFFYCDTLESVFIPNTIQYIRNSAFKECVSLSSVIFEQNSEMLVIENEAFYNCDSLYEITIPSNRYFDYNYLGSNIFGECERLVHITNLSGKELNTLPNNVGLEVRNDPTIDFENTITVNDNGVITYSVGSELFLLIYFGNEATLDLSETGITSIYQSAFAGIDTIVTVILPDSLTSIRDYGFAYCNRLNSIFIPSSVVSIGTDVFYDCNKLVQIRNLSGIAIDELDNMGMEILTDEETDFKNTLTTYNDGYITYTVGTDVYCIDYTGNDTSLDFSGKRITAIYPRAFYYNDNITTVIIPSSITRIEFDAFGDCSNLTSVDFSSDSQLSYIGRYAFSDTALTEISIPSSVTCIDVGAFSNCNSLATVTIDAESQLLSIEAGAFNSTAIAEFFIPSSVTSIGDYAFQDCTGLDTVTFRADSQLEFIGDDAFSGAPWYYSFDDGLKYIGKVFVGYVGTMPDDTLIEIKEGTKSISCYAFSNCSQLASISIPSSVTSIGGYAFSDCTGLSSIILPSQLEKIGDYAFQNCTRFNSIVIPTSVISIGDYAFQNCNQITSITIPASVKTMGYGVFNGCSALKSITLPFIGNEERNATDTYLFPLGYTFGSTSYTNSIEAEQSYYETEYYPIRTDNYYLPADLTTVVITGNDYIAGGAFMNCTNITTVTIPTTVTEIADLSFKGCSGLTTINYDGTMEQWNAITMGTNWNLDTGDYTVVCSDGSIPKA